MKIKISSGFYHRLQVDFSCKSNHIEGSCHNFNNTVKGGSNITYELRHFDTPLMRFTATEDTSSPEIEILWVNEEKKVLLPLDMNVNGDSVSRWLRHRTIPKNRAYVHNFLSKCGLNIQNYLTNHKI